MNKNWTRAQYHYEGAGKKPIDYGRSTAFKRSLVEKLSFLPEPALILTRAFKEVMPFDETIRVDHNLAMPPVQQPGGAK